MKKRVMYKPSVQIRTTCQVISATCTCPAGGTPAFCKHVFALLHAINDYVTKKLYEAPTQRLQTWHQPKSVKMVPQTAEEVFMHEPALEVENEIGFDFTAVPFFTSPLKEVCKNMQEIKLKETIHLPAFVCSGKIATDLPQLGLKEILFYHRHYSKSIDELTALENRTVHQNCSEWRVERKLRLTASDVKKIVCRVANFEALSAQILKKNEVLTNIPAVRYGLENEDYVRHTVQQRNPHYVVRKTGLVVHPIEQYIAASPDGLIRSGEDYMIMEIKCLYNPEAPALKNKNFAKQEKMYNQT
ncbi:SWIM-type domain-containing protein [Trichonephila inaurata madagascariensis]|uniref:SWIM-type domain-containing protein n=1 Tax=Trichonephila inaurata madagascariensis TaxID=2747483 RepID=A0A8X6X7A9_9ARAC|nr:SWIM-type domain-containing protein [Trichonephila inaurata madagascariensis]